MSFISGVLRCPIARSAVSLHLRLHRCYAKAAPPPNIGGAPEDAGLKLFEILKLNISANSIISDPQYYRNVLRQYIDA